VDNITNVEGTKEDNSMFKRTTCFKKVVSLEIYLSITHSETTKYIWEELEINDVLWRVGATSVDDTCVVVKFLEAIFSAYPYKRTHRPTSISTFNKIIFNHSIIQL
jgi:hypothetical protein